MSAAAGHAGPGGIVIAPAARAGRKSALLFMFQHPAGIWLRACRDFGRGDMLVAATVHSRTGGAQ
jgi:hypothetical protein